MTLGPSQRRGTPAASPDNASPAVEPVSRPSPEPPQPSSPSPQSPPPQADASAPPTPGPDLRSSAGGDLTRILSSIDSGDPKAADELLPLVYEELRKLAASKMASQPPGQTIQATALVHEAFIRLSGNSERRWKDHRHFFAAAAEAMRSILIDRVRRKLAARRGGGKQNLPLDAVAMQIESSADQETLLRVNEALDQLESEDSMKAQVVKLRFFVGLSNREIAEILNVTTRTVERAWAYARAWLFRDLKSNDEKS